MKKPNLAAMTPEVAKAIEEMMAEQGEMFSLEKVNLAELTRRTGLSRQKLRRMKAHNFEDTQHAAKGRKSPVTLLSGYMGLLDGLLRNGVTNSAVCLSRLKDGTRHSKNVYAKTRKECEKKLNTLIQEMQAERQALIDQARGVTPPGKLTKTQKKIWTYMKFHPDVTSYRAIARGAGVTRHTAAKWYEIMRGMLGRAA